MSGTTKIGELEMINATPNSASDLANTIAVRMNAYAPDDADAKDEIAFELSKKDAEITTLRAQLEEARAVMQGVLDDTALQSVASWYDSIKRIRALLNGDEK